VLDRAQYAMLQEMQQKLLHATTHDQLTGLLNRREFERRLTESVLGAGHDQPHSLCYFDISQFGIINADGYQAGDRLLIEVRSRSINATPPTFRASAGRYDG
jgi:GGDEF domain-containing protein